MLIGYFIVSFCTVRQRQGHRFKPGIEQITHSSYSLVVKRTLCKREIVGSIPTESTYSSIAQLVERTAVNREVVGSSPAGGVALNT